MHLPLLERKVHLADKTKSSDYVSQKARFLIIVLTFQNRAVSRSSLYMSLFDLKHLVQVIMNKCRFLVNIFVRRYKQTRKFYLTR